MSESNAPLPKKGLPRHVAPDAGEVARQAMGHWALWAVNNRSRFTYTERPSRWHMVESLPGTLPQSADCSAFVTGLARWAGASDPNGNHFRGGYTGTLLAHCNHIPVEQARIGDLIVYGPGTGTHAVFVLERIFGDGGHDFWVVSHGHQGDPSRVLHSRFLSYFGAGSARYLRWLS